MAGHTGKRARRPANCFVCGKPITDSYFLRERQGDKHMACACGPTCRPEHNEHSEACQKRKTA